MRKDIATDTEDVDREVRHSNAKINYA